MEATKIMALKFKLKSKDEVPAELVNLYVERDGAWLLDVDGAVDKAKLEEFRATNVALMKERDELKQRFEGIDPDEVRKLADEKRKLEEAQQLKAGEVEKVVETRLRAVKGDLDKKLASATSERDALNARLTAIQIDQAVVTEATKRGLRARAIPDITSRARNTFRLVNGDPQAFEADGQTARTGKDGVTPLSLATEQGRAVFAVENKGPGTEDDSVAHGRAHESYRPHWVAPVLRRPPRRTPAQPRGLMKILIIKPSSLGDIVHGLVVAQSIREQMPGCILHWVAGERFAPLVQQCPTVDRVLVFQRWGGVRGFVRLIREIRREHYDYALDFQGLARSGLMTWFSRADVRLGRAGAREGAWLAYQKTPPLLPDNNHAHAIEILLKFLPLLSLEARLGSPIQLGSEPLPAPRISLPAHRPIVMAPHSRHRSKEWKGFAALTRLLRESHRDIPVVWCGHRSDASPADLAGDADFHNLTAKTTLGQMVGLLQSARAMVSNDSGPMHIAAAVGTPLVACFGPTDPALCGPYPLSRPTHRVLRAPEGNLARLEVATVLEALNGLLDQRPLPAALPQTA
jgi:heptosyltransferase I